MSNKFKAEPRQLIPEALSVALAGALTYVLQASNAQIVSITIFPETPSGVTLNASIFVVAMAAMATLMYFFIKFGLKRIVRYLINVGVFVLGFLLFMLYGSLYSNVLPSALTSSIWPWIVVSLVGTIILGLAIYKSKGAPHMAATIILGGMMGTFLGVSIPALTAVVLLLFLSGYDLFAVYKGPIGKMAQSTDLEEFTGAVFTYGDLTVGMGDMVFYSMLASSAMMNFGPLPFVAAALGVLAGAYLGFKMLEGRDMFPGLPFAVVLGLVLMYATFGITLLFKHS